MNFSNISFVKQVYLAFAGVVLLTLGLGFSYNTFSSYKNKKESFIHESELQASLIADSSVAPLLFFDSDGLTSSLYQLKKYKNIKQVSVYDNEGNLFASFSSDGISDLRYKDVASIHSETFVVKRTIELDGKEYGTLYLEKSLEGLNDFILNAILNAIGFSTILFLIMAIFTYKLAQKIISPIISLSKELANLSKTHDYAKRLKYNSENEIGQLYNSFNTLFNSIQTYEGSRNEALQQAKSYQEHLEQLTNDLEDRVKMRTQELQNSLDTLKKAQSQLIESEKMASLGSLVSGVAHEVNTPLGNAVTGSTIIKKEAKFLLDSMQNATLKKSTLQESLIHINETSRLLYKSINTAANLVRSFKQMSVDQSIEQKRKFDIVEYVNEIFLTFHNKLKKIPVDVELISEDIIIIDSYPGVFSQLLNNFIQNSIIHGFEDKKDNAKITIELSIMDEVLVLIYADNGSGMDEELKAKAFDPFVTTKRNAGGTGLGLNIVYNLITQKLKGTLVLDTNKNKGTKFIITIPV